MVLPAVGKPRSRRLLVRADAGEGIGTGHVMRCLALAQAWISEGGEVCFACSSCPEALLERLRTEGASVRSVPGPGGGEEDLHATVLVAQEFGARWAAVDGYHFDSAYALRLEEADLAVLEMDDCAPDRHYGGHWILNQNLYAEEGMYPRRAAATRALVGSRYALLRREFWRLRGVRREVRTEGTRLLVTLGGSDPDNATVRVLENLRDLYHEGVEVVVVAGPANPHVTTLRRAIEDLGSGARLVESGPDMPYLMEWADLAVTAAGSTCWESALVGLPSLVFELADNQARVADGLAAAGVAENLGRPGAFEWKSLGGRVKALLADRVKRQRMAGAAQSLVDGYGVQRVTSTMLGQSIWLRRAVSNDCKTIWNWANEPAARANSFSSDPIPWNDHEKWYSARLGDSHCTLFIASDTEDQPVGYVRLDLDGTDAVISISVSPERRGGGLGRAMIEAALRSVVEKERVRRIHAYIRPENLASIKVFARAGFTDAGTARIKGVEAQHFVIAGDGAL